MSLDAGAPVRGLAARLVVVASCALAVAAFAPAGALATTWHVDDDALTEPATCDAALTYSSLTALFGEAGCASEGDTIAIAEGAYPLGADVLLPWDVSIRGAGAGATVLTGTGDRELRIVGTGWLGDPGTFVEVRDLSFSGVGLRNSGSLVLDSVVISDFEREGDAPLSSGGSRFGPHPKLTLLNSTIVGNRGRQGALFNGEYSTATLINTTVADNRGVVSGAIFNFLGSVALVNSTVTGNQVDASIGFADVAPHGGGVWSFGSTTLTNTVVAGNSAPVGSDCYGPVADGAGGHNFVGSLGECGVNERVWLGVSGEPIGGYYTLTFKGATTVPIPHDAATSHVVAALEALPTIGVGNVYAPVESNSGSPTDLAVLEFKGDLGASDQPPVAATSALVGGTVSIWTEDEGVPPQIAPGVNGDLTGSSQVLGTVSSSGGVFATRAPLPGSPLIGAGDAATCQAAPVGDRDGRGVRRWSALRGCDIGAHDTAGFGQRTHGATTCDASDVSARMSVSPPAVRAGPPGLQYVVWRTIFTHYNGATWSYEPADWIVSFATPDQPSGYHWSASGTFLGDSTTVRQSSTAAGSTISLAWHELIGFNTSLSGYEPALITTTTGPSALAGFLCRFPAPVTTPGGQPEDRAPSRSRQANPSPPFVLSRPLARSLASRAQTTGGQAHWRAASQLADLRKMSHVDAPTLLALLTEHHNRRSARAGSP